MLTVHAHAHAQSACIKYATVKDAQFDRVSTGQEVCTHARCVCVYDIQCKSDKNDCNEPLHIVSNAQQTYLKMHLTLTNNKNNNNTTISGRSKVVMAVEAVPIVI